MKRLQHWHYTGGLLYVVEIRFSMLCLKENLYTMFCRIYTEIKLKWIIIAYIQTKAPLIMSSTFLSRSNCEPRKNTNFFRVITGTVMFSISCFQVKQQLVLLRCNFILFLPSRSLWSPKTRLVFISFHCHYWFGVEIRQSSTYDHNQVQSYNHKLWSLSRLPCNQTQICNIICGGCSIHFMVNKQIHFTKWTFFARNRK